MQSPQKPEVLWLSMVGAQPQEGGAHQRAGDRRRAGVFCMGERFNVVTRSCSAAQAKSLSEGHPGFCGY